MTVAHRGLMLCLLLLALIIPAAAQDAAEADLDSIKTYLLEKTTGLQEQTTLLKEAADEYYALLEKTGFDYAAAWENDAEAITAALTEAKDAWMAASPLYEQMEGIVAGVPSLAEYDVILDAGVSGEEDPEGGVPFDLTLPDGRVLPRPGNLFNLLESTLWGTRADFIVADIDADLDGDGEIEFGEALPEANMLKGSAETIDSYAAELFTSAEAWEPTESDAFTALVVMVPTMSEYFGSWKESRFVSGEESTSENFAVISRLSDIQDILSSLSVIYVGVSPLVKSAGSEQYEQILTDLTDLQAYVADLYEQEQDGRQFTPEEADIYGSEAQDRAMTITGQIAQVAALLDIPLAE